MNGKNIQQKVYKPFEKLST